MSLELTTYEDVKIQARNLSVFSGYKKLTLSLPENKFVEVNLSEDDVANLIFMLKHSSA